MSKFMQFDLNVKNVFENDESNYDSFNKLMLDYSHNMLDGISAREANDKIVEILVATRSQLKLKFVEVFVEIRP